MATIFEHFKQIIPNKQTGAKNPVQNHARPRPWPGAPWSAPADRCGSGTLVKKLQGPSFKFKRNQTECLKLLSCN
jgi:hypothetical protein